MEENGAALSHFTVHWRCFTLKQSECDNYAEFLTGLTSSRCRTLFSSEEVLWAEI